jgi:hypothetical protein
MESAVNGKQLHYDLISAGLLHGITEHPQRQMIKLGYKVIDSEPLLIVDKWWFKVEEIIHPLPGYLTEV